MLKRKHLSHNNSLTNIIFLSLLILKFHIFYIHFFIIMSPTSQVVGQFYEEDYDNNNDNEINGGGDGVGPSIYETLKGYVNELGKVMKDIKVGVDKVANGIQSVEDILDATLEEDCIYQCLDGEVLYSNSNHVPSSNGCGSFGLENYLTKDMIPFINQFVDCCNEHDICYGTCLNDKDLCDLKFKKCLYKKCSIEKETLSNKLKLKGCKAGAKILYTGTASLGCKPYINAQKEACLCKKQKHKTHGGHKPIKDEF